MKTFVAIIMGTFMVYCAWAQETAEQTTASQSGPVITFAEDSHDFGDIFQGDKVEHIFKFENTGTEPLIISNVQVTCGCTTKSFPRDPIMPGGNGEINIMFNSAGKMGKQNKIITVVSNAVASSTKISITTNVLPKKDTQ